MGRSFCGNIVDTGSILFNMYYLNRRHNIKFNKVIKLLHNSSGNFIVIEIENTKTIYDYTFSADIENTLYLEYDQIFDISYVPGLCGNGNDINIFQFERKQFKKNI